MKQCFYKLLVVFLSGLLLLALWFGWWIGWGEWPHPKLTKLPWKPDAILVLGGGNEERPREAVRLSNHFPDLPVIVTGDNSIIFNQLVKSGVSPSKIIHEKRASSTVENAKQSRKIFDQIKAKNILIVTNWFHVPRSRAVFRRFLPEREIAFSFEPKPKVFSNWHRYATRRERLAAILYIFRYQIWSFCSP